MEPWNCIINGMTTIKGDESGESEMKRLKLRIFELEDRVRQLEKEMIENKMKQNEFENWVKNELVKHRKAREECIEEGDFYINNTYLVKHKVLTAAVRHCTSGDVTYLYDEVFGREIFKKYKGFHDLPPELHDAFCQLRKHFAYTKAGAENCRQFEKYITRCLTKRFANDQYVIKKKKQLKQHDKESSHNNSEGVEENAVGTCNLHSD